MQEDSPMLVPIEDETPETAFGVVDRTKPNASATQNMVSIRSLFVTYGKVQAVRGIDLEIPRGEVFGFIGPNGAGKSSTMKVLATLLSDFRGEAYVNGIDVRRQPFVVRETIGYMPDFFGVYDDLTVEEYLYFFTAAYRMPMNKRMPTIKDVLELTDLSYKIKEPVDGLSRGMKQRLSLARVLLHDPELLLLDEPASGLDPRARIEIRELLKALSGMGKTILISSHILHELGQLCSRIGIIEQGQMVAQGSLSDIYRQLQLTRVIHCQLADANDEMISRIEALPGVRDVEKQTDRISVRLDEEVSSIEDFHDQLHDLGGRIRMFPAGSHGHGNSVHETNRRKNCMNALTQLGLPLLTKELVEQAARRRTYIVRVVYATLLFMAGFAFYYQLANQYNSRRFCHVRPRPPTFFEHPHAAVLWRVLIHARDDL